MNSAVERNQGVASLKTATTSPPWAGSAGSYQASIISPTGANSFTLDIEVSNDGVNWLSSYLSLTGTSVTSTPASDGDSSLVNYAFARVNCSGLSLGGGSYLQIRRSR